MARWAAFIVALMPATLFADDGIWRTNGPPGGASIVVVDPGDPSIVYTENARSTDGGATWQRYSLNSGPPLAAGPSHTVYVGSGGALYVSRDAGLSWTLLFSGISNSPDIPFSGTIFNSLYVDPVNPSTLYGTATEFVFARPLGSFFERSTDGGHTWTPLNVPLFVGDLGAVASVALDPKTSGTLYVSGTGPGLAGMNPSGTLKSTDAGNSWTQLPAPFPNVLSVDPQQPSTVYADVLFSKQLLKSTDGGATFNPVNDNFAVAQLIVSPTDSNRLIAQNSVDVFESDDGGASFQTITNGLIGPTSVAIDPTGKWLYAATRSGVYRSAVDPFALELNTAHPFTIRLSATDPHTGQAVSGMAIQTNDLWGYFSIPAITGNPSNPEVFVKMLDGTTLNGSYWFFYGGLTNLQYTLTVTEHATGTQKTYTNPAGSECGGSDTAAFTP